MGNAVYIVTQMKLILHFYGIELGRSCSSEKDSIAAEINSETGHLI